MNGSELPHAAALACELDAEVQRLDALQQTYIQQLVDELSDVSFLTLEYDDALSPQSNRALSPAPTPVPLVKSTADGDGLLRPCAVVGTLVNVAEASRGSSPPTEENQWLDSAAAECVAAASSGFCSKKAAPSPSLDKKRSDGQLFLHGKQNEGDTIRERDNALQVSSASPPAVPRNPLPLPQGSRRGEEARRARQALRCIREERDAHFNAKARRAQELLREGREAMRKSQERRLTQSAAARRAKGTAKE
jgi:hypothetical protein